MEEVTYLREGGFLVTNTRIDIQGQTFAVRNVGSVKVEDSGRPMIGIVMAILGAFITQGSILFGLLLLVPGVVIAWQGFKEKRLVLMTGGGETVALKSTNVKAVEQLRSAIATAISAR